MVDKNLGYRTCYICGSGLDPLTSTCPDCGYSQLPEEDGKTGKPPSLKQTQDDLRSGLKSKLDQAKADYKARLKKK